MSASFEPAVRTIARQLAQALATYQHDFDEMVESRMDTPRFRSVNRQLQDIRLMKGSFPALSEEMAEVLLRHVELVHSVWNAQIRLPGDDLGEMPQLRRRHRTAVDDMRRKCLALARADCEPS